MSRLNKDLSATSLSAGGQSVGRVCVVQVPRHRWRWAEIGSARGRAGSRSMGVSQAQLDALVCRRASGERRERGRGVAGTGWGHL